MKILIIPDQHGQSNGLKVAKEKIDEVDFVVFLGDFFDNYSPAYRGMKAVENFKDICSFARNNKEKVKLVIGNHDLDNYIYFGQCSGFQREWFNEYNKALAENIDLLNIAYEIDGYVFSHAGFSTKWVENLENTKWVESLKNKERKKDFVSNDYWKSLTVIEKTNYLFHKQFNESGHINRDYDLRNWFTFYRWDMSGYGENSNQSPIWIRPQALLENAYFNKQVVGHTEYCIDDYVALKDKENYVLLCDSKNHVPFGVFDTENPPVAITYLELQREYKKKVKKINDLLSKFGTPGEVFTEKKKMEIIKEEFGDKAQFYYENYFKE